MLRRSLLVQVLVVPFLVAGLVGTSLLLVAPTTIVDAYGGPDTVLTTVVRFAFTGTMALMFFEALRTDMSADRYEGAVGEPWSVFPNRYDAGLIAAAMGLII